MIIANDNISTQEMRRLLRDPINRKDNLLMGIALGQGIIGPNYVQSIPSAVKRIESNKPYFKYGTSVYGKSSIPKVRYRDNLRFKSIVPEKQYNPLNKTKIDGSTLLGGGMPLSIFSNSALNSKIGLDSRKEIAKYFYLQSLLMNSVHNNSGRFSKFSLRVVDGLYVPEANQTVTSDSILDLQTKGRAVIYEVINSKGETDSAATFNVASYWKDTALFDTMILSYDTLDPNVESTVQIIVTMPEVDTKYKGTFSRNVRTEFNYNIALQNGLAELAV
jgi:hypothetical protein